jgi:pectate lyase
MNPRGNRFAALATAALLCTTSFSAAQTSDVILFSDTFEDGVADGWTPDGGVWSVVPDGTRVYAQAGYGGPFTSRAGKTTWTHYSVQARVKTSATSAAVGAISVLARVRVIGNLVPPSYYALSLFGGRYLRLTRVVNGASTVLAEVPYTSLPGTWYLLKLDAQGTRLTGSVNGVPLLRASDGVLTTGAIGVGTQNAPGRFDNVLVTASPYTIQ